jgi:hypothetical protein
MLDLMAEDANAWHRRVGATLFNRCWELIESDARTSDQDAEMLLTAATSRWHWGEVGGPGEVATGDWQVAHVASLLGMADLALMFAARNLAIAEAEGWDGWRLASAHEGMARACATAGDTNGRDAHVATARRLLDEERDAESRQVIAEQLATVPDASGAGPS